jgi:hypothetical protein
MYQKLTQEQQLELEFRTRRLKSGDFHAVLTLVLNGHQQIKNGQRLSEEALLDFMRGYAHVRDIMVVASHAEFLEKKHGITSVHLSQCHEILGHYREKELSVTDFFAQFAPNNPDISNKPRRK